MEVVPVPAFTDNYIWLVRDEASGETAVVDPGDAAPALAETERRGWRVTQVWNTHHHWDHSGGNLAMKEATGCTVSGPAAENIPGRDVALSEGSELRIGGHIGRVIVDAMKGMQIRNPGGVRVFRSEDHQFIYNVPAGRPMMRSPVSERSVRAGMFSGQIRMASCASDRRCTCPGSPRRCGQRRSSAAAPPRSKRS